MSRICANRESDKHISVYKIWNWSWNRSILSAMAFNTIYWTCSFSIPLISHALSSSMPFFIICISVGNITSFVVCVYQLHWLFATIYLFRQMPSLDSDVVLHFSAVFGSLIECHFSMTQSFFSMFSRCWRLSHSSQFHCYVVGSSARLIVEFACVHYTNSQNM